MKITDQIKLMAEVQRTVIDYLQDEAKINGDALRAYDPSPLDDDKREPEVKRFREIQAMILRDRINELNRYMAVIKRMYPNA
jgi:hypothetical protein